MKTAIIKNETLVKIFEKALVDYQEKLEKNPTSTFYKELVKNTKEYLQEFNKSSSYEDSKQT